MDTPAFSEERRLSTVVVGPRDRRIRRGSLPRWCRALLTCLNFERAASDQVDSPAPSKPGAVDGVARPGRGPGRRRRRVAGPAHRPAPGPGPRPPAHPDRPQQPRDLAACSRSSREHGVNGSVRTPENDRFGKHPVTVRFAVDGVIRR